MSQDTPRDPSAFKPPCPACRAGHGLPMSVSAAKRQRTIGYRCPKCEHVWEETIEHPDDPFWSS